MPEPATQPAGPDDLAVIKDCIRARLRASGRKQKHLAQSLGMSEKHVSQVLSGTVTGTFQVIAAMAREVGMPLVPRAEPVVFTVTRDQLAAAIAGVNPFDVSDGFPLVDAILSQLTDIPPLDPARQRTEGHHHLCTCALCGPVPAADPSGFNAVRCRHGIEGALSVPCPECKRPAGSRCVTLLGEPSDLVHRARDGAPPAAGTAAGCPVQAVFGPDDVHDCALPRGHELPHKYGPAHAIDAPAGHAGEAVAEHGWCLCHEDDEDEIPATGADGLCDGCREHPECMAGRKPAGEAAPVPLPAVVHAAGEEDDQPACWTAGDCWTGHPVLIAQSPSQVTCTKPECAGSLPARLAAGTGEAS